MKVRIIEALDKWGDVIWKVQCKAWWGGWVTKEWYGSKQRAEKTARVLKSPTIEEI